MLTTVFLISFLSNVLGHQIGLLDVRLTSNKVHFQLYNQDHGEVLSGILGVNIPDSFKEPTEFNSATQTEFKWGSTTSLKVGESSSSGGNGADCYKVQWRTTKSLSVLEDCFNLDQDVYWYGGPEEFTQHFPLDPTNSRLKLPYVPGDMIQDKNIFYGGVTEPYWLSSTGVAIFVPEGSAFLHYSWNASETVGSWCLSSQPTPPYPDQNEIEELELSYLMCVAGDPKAMHLSATNTFLGKPAGTPDKRMMKEPIWSTWAQYKADINQSTVMKFSKEIHNNGFKASQVEIDDNWETCYGDAEFNLTKFPDPKQMTKDLMDLYNFRTTLWIHPFINTECSDTFEHAIPFLVKSTKHTTSKRHLPGLTYWWNGFTAGIVDFTNPSAVSWWLARLQRLKDKYGIHSFKFDAGEINSLPPSIILDADVKYWPEIYTKKYVEAVSLMGNDIEVRVGSYTQSQSMFVRMLDKDSVWGYDNGLKTLVTTLLQTSMTGHPFVLPDMIGGNAYNGEFPSKELYIRWMQANVFMPSVQFSIVPWQYEDRHVVEICLKMLDIRNQYSDLLVKLAQESVDTGAPINRPIWWVDPYDKEALKIDSEFMLGNSILVAPVLDEGMTSRDIYLPKGTWLYEDKKQTFTGPKWLKDFPADLKTLPFFTLVQDNDIYIEVY